MAEDPALHAQAQEAQEIFNQIGEILVNREAGVQGAALAICLGTWIAGFLVTKGGTIDWEKTKKLRAKLFAQHINNALLHATAQDQQRQKGPEKKQ